MFQQKSKFAFLMHILMLLLIATSSFAQNCPPLVDSLDGNPLHKTLDVNLPAGGVVSHDILFTTNAVEIKSEFNIEGLAPQISRSQATLDLTPTLNTTILYHLTFLNPNIDTTVPMVGSNTFGALGTLMHSSGQIALIANFDPSNLWQISILKLGSSTSLSSICTFPPSANNLVTNPSSLLPSSTPLSTTLKFSIFMLTGQANATNLAFEELFNRNISSKIEILNNENKIKSLNANMKRARRHIKRARFLYVQDRIGKMNLGIALKLLKPTN